MKTIFVIDKISSKGTARPYNDTFYVDIKDVRKKVSSLNKKLGESAEHSYGYRKLKRAPTRSNTINVNFESSTLDVGRYKAKEKILLLKFKNGSIYMYKDISKTEFEELCSAESQGRYFAQNIKSCKSFARLTD